MPRKSLQDAFAELHGSAAGAGVSAAARVRSRLDRNDGEPAVKVAAAAADVDGLDNLSLEELIELSARVDRGEAPPATKQAAAAGDAEARRQLRAKVAAHAFHQEVALIKLCNAQGLCRFCKENAATPGTSVCADCAKSEA